MPCQNPRMFSRSLALLTILMIILVGCGKAPKPHGGDLPDTLHLRVISLSPNLTELVSLVNQEQKLVGRTSGCDYPETPSLEATPIVANPTPDLEKILQAQPDLILVDENLINPSFIQKFKDAGVRTELFKMNSIKEWIAAVEMIGNLLMSQRAASDAVDEMKSVMHLNETDPLPSSPRVLVLMGAQKPMAAGIASFQADAVRAAGGTAVGPEDSKFVFVNPEQVIKWDPDIIIVPGAAAEYQKNATLGKRPGGGARTIIGVNESFLLRAGARAKDLIRGLHTELMKFSKK